MNIKQIQKEAFDHAVKCGFHPSEVADKSDVSTLYISSRIALVHSELSEALEETRNEEFDVDAFAFELADVVIRVADLAEMLNIDLDHYITEKIAKNKTREYQHGRRRL